MNRRSPSTKWKVTTKEPRFPLPLLLLLSMLLSQCSQPSNFPSNGRHFARRIAVDSTRASFSFARRLLITRVLCGETVSSSGAHFTTYYTSIPNGGPCATRERGWSLGSKEQRPKINAKKLLMPKGRKRGRSLPTGLLQSRVVLAYGQHSEKLLMGFLHQKCTRLFFFAAGFDTAVSRD